MDRSDFYFEQEVTEAELDQVFDDAENADRALVADHVDGAHATWGVLTGYEVTENSGGADLNVEIANGAAYDEDGQRIPFDSGPKLLDLSSAVPVSNSRYVRIYAEFTRDMSDPRVDGAALPIDYRQTEGVVFSTDLGTSAPSPTKPAILANKVLLATPLLYSGMTQIFNADISQALDEDPANPGDVDRQEGGVAVPHGRMATRSVYFDPTGAPSARLNMGGHLLETYGGDVDGGKTGTDDGNVVKMLAVHARSPDPGASPVEGHVYGDDAGALVDVTKYAAYDASDMLAFGNDDAWQGVGPNWFLEEDNQFSDFLGGLGWRFNFGAGSGPIGSPGLYVPVHLPHGAKLISASVGYRVRSAPDADHYLRLWLLRRNLAGNTVDMIGSSNPPSNERNGSVGNYTWAETFNAGATQIVNNQLYRYYLTIEHYLSANKVLASEDVYTVRAAQIEYQIREASGVY